MGVDLLGWGTVWWTLGFNAVIYLAGLQDIDPALYDAAKVDGANRWQRFWHVTLPGLRPVLLFIITITILASANMFGQAYLLTEGAPARRRRRLSCTSRKRVCGTSGWAARRR